MAALVDTMAVHRGKLDIRKRRSHLKSFDVVYAGTEGSMRSTVSRQLAIREAREQEFGGMSVVQ